MVRYILYVQKTAISRRLEPRRDKHLGATAYDMVIEIKKLDECPWGEKKKEWLKIKS